MKGLLWLAMPPRARRLPLLLGITLVLGGLAHSAGVLHLYAKSGFPSLDRLLLDVWIAEPSLPT